MVTSPINFETRNSPRNFEVITGNISPPVIIEPVSNKIKIPPIINFGAVTGAYDTEPDFRRDIKDITFNDIAHCLTGCARLIKYDAIFGDCYSKDVSLLRIICIEEGEFVNGKKNGYCRVINGHTNTVNFGIYKDDLP